jgi:hypothetical protein
LEALTDYLTLPPHSFEIHLPTAESLLPLLDADSFLAGSGGGLSALVLCVRACGCDAEADSSDGCREYGH